VKDITAPVHQSISPAEEVSLPPGAPAWLPILALWPEVTESCCAEISGCFADVAPIAWSELQSWLVETGVAEAGPESPPVTLMVRPRWLAVLSEALAVLVDEPSLRTGLFTWVQTHQPSLTSRFAGWARDAGRWDVLREIWLGLDRRKNKVAVEVLRVFADLPDDARREYPMLTWAGAAAAADAAPVEMAASVFVDHLILDSVTLHYDWSLREDMDAAVLAGVLRMFGERHLPSSMSPLDAAWRTKMEIDAFIDQRSRKGQTPGRAALSFFRVMAARLALFRADLPGATAEAYWAGVLAKSPSVAELAVAIQALAQNLAGEVREAALGEASSSPDSYRFGSLDQMAAVMTTLARGRQSLQLLDRVGVDAALASIPLEMAAIAGVSSSVIGLTAMRAAVWGDARLGLNKMMAALARQPVVAREQDEPLGGLMLGRARSILLCQIGAFGAATLCVASVGERFRSVPEARTLLWAGQLGQAVRAMEVVLTDPDLQHVDRLQLLMIKGAATKLDNSITADVEEDTVSACRYLVQGRSFLPFAMLPGKARDAILVMCESLAAEPDTGEQFAELCERLRGVKGGGKGFGLLQLTEREAILLPLLATSDSVPLIARKLQVSVHTVRTQTATLREKFQASTRAELVRKAGAYGALN